MEWLDELAPAVSLDGLAGGGGARLVGTGNFAFFLWEILLSESSLF